MDEHRHEWKPMVLARHITGLSRRRFLGVTGRLAAALTFGRMTRGRHATPAAGDGGTGSPAQLTKQMVRQLSTTPPFSFTYEGQHSATLLARWAHTLTHHVLDATRTEHVITWTEQPRGLVVRCVAVEYHDFPTVEWTLYLTNSSTHALPLADNILAVDTTFTRHPSKDIVLHTCNGSLALLEDFGPHDIPLPPHAQFLLTCDGGRPTCGIVRQAPHLVGGGFPYYNVDWGGYGLIAAIGWPGQWAAEMTRDGATGLHLQAGMSTIDRADLSPDARIADTGLTAIALQPGEQIRTPLVVVQFWQGGDWIDAQNVWRRWMIAHNMPHPGGRPPQPMCPAQPGGITLDITAAFHLSEVKVYAADHLTATTGGVYDHWWIDAGWYAVPPEATDWTWTGTWKPDPTRYPQGFRPVTAAARAKGMKSIIWHEPERVRPNTDLYNTYPQWLLGPGPDGDARLLNLGNPAAWRWAVEHFAGLIRAGGIDVFRNDFNIEPLAYWNTADAPNRRGSTQIRYVTGFLAFWDELLRRHPHLLIDTCASGGRRLDVETLRRSVPLWRSDLQGDATTEQCHSYGLSLWSPYHGTGVGPSGAQAMESDLYLLRSAMIPSYMVFLKPDAVEAPTLALVRRMTREWRTFADDLLGDYYPLTPYSTFDAVWIAWQFNRPDTGTGVVQAFARDYSPASSMRLRLRGLEPTALYAVQDADKKGTLRVSGRQLMTAGLAVHLAQLPGAATLTYRRLTSG